jgi:hypothetical protein
MMSSASSPYRRWFFARGAAMAAVPAATPARNADDAAAHFGGGQ